MGRVRTGELNRVSEIGEGLVDVTAFSEFSAAIHTNVLVEALGSVAGEPAVDPVDWWSLHQKVRFCHMVT
jgi:hypothetical protein